MRGGAKNAFSFVRAEKCARPLFGTYVLRKRFFAPIVDKYDKMR